MAIESIRFSVVIGAYQTDAWYFKQSIESAKALDWKNMEIQVLDACPEANLDKVTNLVMKDDYRLKYVKLRPKNSLADVWNEGIRRAQGDYLIFVGLTDRLNTMILRYLSDYIADHPECDIIYTDHDEIRDDSRMNPYFLPDFNKELLLGQNYIGDTFIVKRDAFKRLGFFRKELSFAFAYDFFIRAMNRKATFGHIAALLWHNMVFDTPVTDELIKLRDRSLREHMTVVSAYLNENGIKGKLEHGLNDSWQVRYDGSDYERHLNSVLLIKNKGVYVTTRNAAEKLYGYVSQPDVAIAGGKFVSGFQINNCGYIYDKDGVTYPACRGENPLSPGLYGRIRTASDVSMVDFSFCMVDALFFKKCGGFDSRLKGNDMILDLCLKARAGGLRVVYVPRVTAHRGIAESGSDETSREILREKWHKTITAGDPFYNRNLPSGMKNYYL